MKKLKPTLRNLKCNLPLLGSFLGLLGLTLGMEEGMLRMCLTLFGLLLILSPFFTCGLPLGRGLFSNRKAAVVAAVTEFTMLLQYYKFPALSFLQEMAEKCHVPLQWLTIGLGFLLCGVGFYATYVLWVRALTLLAPMKELLRSYKKQLLILCVIFCISLIGIIRANFYYIDDLKRILEDYSLAGAFSRHISSFMAALFHGDSWLADISPLSQLIAACFLSLAAVILYEAVSDNREMGFWGLVSLIPVGLFPFFLSCYSFKFDAPYMALSVLAAVAPLAYRREKPLKFALISMLGTIVVCTTYQASSGILPLTCLAMGLGMWCRKVDRTQVRSFLFSAAGGYVAGMLLFRFVLMTNPYEYGDYVNTSIDLLAIVPNLKKYVSLILNGFTAPWLLLLVGITCSYFLVMLYHSKRNKPLTLLLTVVTAACLFVLSLGVNIALQSPLFEARALYGLGIAVSIFCIEIALAEKQSVSKAAVLLLSLSFVSFSFVYGNALYLQKDYTDFRMTHLVSDLVELDVLQEDANIKIQVKGSVGYADQITRSLITYPLLRELIPIQLQDSDWYWGDYELLYHTGLKGIIQKELELDLSTMGLPVLKDTVFHTIRGNQDYILIELKE